MVAQRIFQWASFLLFLTGVMSRKNIAVEMTTTYSSTTTQNRRKTTTSFDSYAELVDLHKSLQKNQNTTYQPGAGAITVSEKSQQSISSDSKNCFSVLLLNFDGTLAESQPPDSHNPSWQLTLRPKTTVGESSCIEKDTWYEGLFAVGIDHFRSSSCFNFRYIGRFYAHEIDIKSNGDLNSLALDFEVHCETLTNLPALFGWVRIHTQVTIDKGLIINPWKVQQQQHQYAKYISMPGDMIGGQNSVAELFQIEVKSIGCGNDNNQNRDKDNNSNNSTIPLPYYLAIELGDYDGFMAKFVASASASPVSGASFQVDHWYENAVSFNNPTTQQGGPPDPPEMYVTGFERACGTLTGKFIIHELRLPDQNNCNAAENKINASFAIDFQQHCGDETAPPLFGFIRFNSNVTIDEGMIQDWKKTTPAPTISMKPSPAPTDKPTLSPTRTRRTRPPVSRPSGAPPSNAQTQPQNQNEQHPLGLTIVVAILIFAVVACPIGGAIGCISPYANANDINKDYVLLTAAVLFSSLGGIVGGILGGLLLGPFVVAGYMLTRRCLFPPRGGAIPRQQQQRQNRYDVVHENDETDNGSNLQVEQELPPML